MTQPFFPCTISAQPRNNEFLTIKTAVRKTHQNNGHTGSSCLDKAVLAQGGGGVPRFLTTSSCHGAVSPGTETARHIQQIRAGLLQGVSVLELEVLSPNKVSAPDHAQCGNCLRSAVSQEPEHACPPTTFIPCAPHSACDPCNRWHSLGQASTCC